MPRQFPIPNSQFPIPNSQFPILISILMIMGFSPIHSQVLTRHLAPDQNTEEIIPFPLDENIPYYMQPEVDFDKVLEQDMANGITIPRFAVKVEQNYTVKDGLWSQLGGMRIWQIGFSASDASSLNFLISDLNLPIKSEMFILSKNGRIIHGPITPDVIFDQVYASDIIESNDAIIVVKCNKDNYNQFSINVNGVCQGIPKPIETRDWQDADSCNYDVNCSVGAGWENERDAVALVIKNGTEWCSGSLVNDECQDLRPFFLTAFHCLDLNEDGELSNSEKDLSNYTFRFKYEASDPKCPGKSTGTQGNWITYSGAVFKAAYFTSDFVLAELNGSIKGQSQITVAGWDNRNITPTSTTIIHHPIGDAKKITLDFDTAQQSTIKGRQCWWLQVDLGATDHVSSGAPYFNQDKRIIAQHYGVNDANLPVCSRANKFGGRFDLSWTGGGTNDTRLSNWLGGSNPPNTTNTIRVPTVNSITSNDFLICTTNKQITLSNAIPGRTVSWSVNNTTLFATTNGAATSGNGIVAILRAASSTSSGSAVLTFTLSQSGCDDIVITQAIWVGLPDFGLIYNDPVCVGDYEWAFLDLYGARAISLGTIDWTFSGVINGTGTLNKARFRGMTPGWGEICIKATNGCGERLKCFSIYVDYCGGGQYSIQPQEKKIVKTSSNQLLHVNPNPFNNTAVIHLSLFNANDENLIKIYDITGKLIVQKHILENNTIIDLSIYPSGIYFIHYRNDNQVLTEKIIKL